MKVFEIRCEVQWVCNKTHEHYYIVAAESEETAIRLIDKKNNRFNVVEDTIRINELKEETVLHHVDETYEQEKYEMEHDDYEDD